MNLNPLNFPKLREALSWHESGKLTSPRAMSALYTDSILAELARLRGMMERMRIYPYLVQLHARGQDIEPLPASEQPLLFEKRVDGYELPTWEFYRHTYADHTALCRQMEEDRDQPIWRDPMLIAISEQESETDDTHQLGFWNAAADGPCGIAYLRLPVFEIPEHGLRLSWQRIV